MKLQQLLSYIRKALEDYRMIEAGDINYTIVESNISEIVLEHRKESSPCQVNVFILSGNEESN